MADAGAQIQQLRQQAQAVQAQRARAEHQRDTAQQSVAQAERELLAEFGVSSVAEGEVVLNALGLQITQQVAVVAQALAQAGAQQ
jgi:hypothetical protein